MDPFLTSDESDGSASADEEPVNVSDEELEETPENSREWKTATEISDRRNEQLPRFLGTPGVNPGLIVPLDNLLACFSLFLTYETVSRLAQFTNARAWEELRALEREQGGQQLPSILVDWKDCSENEIRKTIAIIFYIRVVRKPEIKSCWATSNFYYNKLFQSDSCLSRNRFQQIFSYLRFYDCRVADARDPLCKIRSFLYSVREVCQQNFTPEREISVDEELVQHKGRLAFRQYIPSKRARYGIKTYCLCDAKSGYLWNILIHSTVKENGKFGCVFNGAGLSVSERIVAELSKDLFQLGYRVFLDSFFCSHRLAQFLMEQKTQVTVTVRCDRGAEYDAPSSSASSVLVSLDCVSPTASANGTFDLTIEF